MKITLTRLPDINTERDIGRYGYKSYGRFALLRRNGLWYGDLHSSHPSTTQTGWYWAVTAEGELIVSPRGAGIDGEMLVNERKDILAMLVQELVRRKIIGRPSRLQLQV
jgi:hypothetical protein